jgi:hypothetical protein
VVWVVYLGPVHRPVWSTRPGPTASGTDIRVAGAQPWDWLERQDLIRAKVADLLDAGATQVREEQYSDKRGTVLGHVVVLDPEGRESCVA